MADLSNPRVAVYIDFDNIVVSRYNQLYGRAAWTNDSARNFAMAGGTTGAGGRGAAAAADGIPAKLEQARVDIGAILDYASSFGSIVVNRAYADWSAPANSSYSRQLIDRAVDLTQLFNTAGTKNGGDIRLAVDVVDDLFRLDDITHVVIVAGDSDYIALAQRAKRLGRFVVGIGVAGATSRALVAACDEFTDYDEVPGVVRPTVEPVGENRKPAGRVAAKPRIETIPPDEPSNHPTFSHPAGLPHRPGRGDRPAATRAAAHRREERRGVADERRGEVADDPAEPGVQGEVARLQVVHRVPQLARW